MHVVIAEDPNQKMFHNVKIFVGQKVVCLFSYRYIFHEYEKKTKIFPNRQTIL